MIILSINKEEVSITGPGQWDYASLGCVGCLVNMLVVYMFVLFLIDFAVATDEKTAVLILARGGSKGVRLKNLQTVGGVSLITRAIHTAKAAGLHDITVSTDHPLIALESIESGANVFHRCPITATDWAPSIWGAVEFLSSRLDIEVLVLIQATSPFTQSTNLSGALRKLCHPVPFDCIFSATRSYKLRWKHLNTGVAPINFDIRTRPRRQDWKGELLETGAFYIVRRNVVMNGSFQNDNCTVWEVSSAESFEVDSYHDLQVANALLSSNLV